MLFFSTPVALAHHIGGVIVPEFLELSAVPCSATPWIRIAAPFIARVARVKGRDPVDTALIGAIKVVIRNFHTGLMDLGR